MPAEAGDPAHTRLAAWRRATAEPPLAPEISIVDPHHHFWSHGFLADAFGRFMPRDFDDLIARSGQRVVATVFLDARWRYRRDGPKHLRCVRETERVEAVAEAWAAKGEGHARLAAGIVGAADLLVGDAVKAVLEGHAAASPSRFRGVRHAVAYDPDDAFAAHGRPGVMGDPKFREGLACLNRTGLVFETWCVHTQLGELADLAAAFPEIPMVLNHLGTPLGVGRFEGRREEVFTSWKSGISELARRPNVVIKLGGLGMPGAGFNWATDADPPTSKTVADAYRPYVLHAVEAFTPSRCMFESNFAVDGMSYGYGAMWNAFKRVTSSFSESDRRALFHDTAVRFYRLESPPSTATRDERNQHGR